MFHIGIEKIKDKRAEKHRFEYLQDPQDDFPQSARR